MKLFWGCPSFLTESINIPNNFKSNTFILINQIFPIKKLKLTYLLTFFVFIDMKVKINDNIFKVKTLIDNKSKSIGMMGKKFDKTFNGLLFLIGGDKQSFWMKNCIIPLDIIIIKNNVIVNIHHNCPPCRGNECPSYGGNGNIVLEVKGGTCEYLDIESGDTVEYLF